MANTTLNRLNRLNLEQQLYIIVSTICLMKSCPVSIFSPHLCAFQSDMNHINAYFSMSYLAINPLNAINHPPTHHFDGMLLSFSLMTLFHPHHHVCYIIVARVLAELIHQQKFVLFGKSSPKTMDVPPTRMAEVS